MCKPDKGAIPPGKTANIAVIWTPKFGKKNEASLVLSVVGGNQRIITLSGEIPETKVFLFFYDNEKLIHISLFRLHFLP